MNLTDFRNKLFELILLLIGLYFLRLIPLFLIPIIAPASWNNKIGIVSHWIGNAIFGFILLARTIDNKKVAMSLGLLGTCMPSFGAVFYLFTISKRNQ